MSLSDLWEKIIKSPSYIPAQITVKPGNTDNKEQLQKRFKRNEDYFLVRVNEMYLSYKRKWLSTYDPMVFVISEFLYDGEKVSVPFVVGPSMLNNKLNKVPEGMIFKDTSVAGFHPFRGGEFSVGIVLARLRQDDYIRKIIKLVESTSGTYTGGFATMINQYIKVASIVADGIDSLMNKKDVEPLMGYRKPFQSDVDYFGPSYFALINSDEKGIEEDHFFVKNNSLYYGDTIATAKPYRNDDYVLYSFMSSPSRSDYETLPFHKQWKEIVSAIGNMPRMDDDDKAIINGKLFSLQSYMENSPDLTRPQVEELIEDYTAQKEKLVAVRSKRLSGPGDEKGEAPPVDEWKDKMRSLSLQILRS